MEKQAKEEAREQKKAASTSTRKEKDWTDSPMVKQAGRTAASIITRSLLGVLGLGGSTRSRKKSSWF